MRYCLLFDIQDSCSDLSGGFTELITIQINYISMTRVLLNVSLFYNCSWI